MSTETTLQLGMARWKAKNTIPIGQGSVNGVRATFRVNDIYNKPFDLIVL